MMDPITTIETEIERLSGTGVLPMQETLTIRDVVATLRSNGGVEFRPTGRAIFADEVGSKDWQAAKNGGSKVDLIRSRLEAGEKR